MDRRAFLQGLGAATLLGATALTAPRAGALPVLPGTFEQQVPELFAPSPLPPEHSDVLVIGSGFGASVAALRFAEAGSQVTVLERGLRWPRDPWREIFSSEPMTDGRGLYHRTTFVNRTGIPVVADNFAGVLDITDYPGMAVWRGAAVGGGSVVFTGAMIAPERHFFDQVFGGRLGYDEMASTWYPKVRRQLRLSPLPGDLYAAPEFTHSRRWDADARAAGYQPEPVDGIWNWDILRAEASGRSRRSALVSESTMGNSNGAKFDLTQNYIPAAEATGRAVVCHGHLVRAIGQDPGGRYWVQVDRRTPFGTVLATTTLTCDRLVLGAGSVGTTELLVQAQATGTLPRLNEHIGHGWGPNGDAAMVRSFAITDNMFRDQAAPCASRIVDESGLPLSMESWYAAGINRDLGVLASLGMTMDPTRGSFTWDPGAGRAMLRWPAGGGLASADALRAVQNRMAAAGGTMPGLTPMALDVDVSFTAHPLGGAVLGNATDGYGRVHGHPGLYVVDGALIPGSTGTANPSLTITALAERNLAAVIASGR